MAFFRNGATGINHILSHSDVESILLSRGVPQETLNIGFKMLEKDMLTEKEFADIMRLWKDDITVTRGSACDEE